MHIAVLASLLLIAPRFAALAQSTDASRLHLSASALPLVTRATPTAERRSLTEAYLAQPMINVAWLARRAGVVGTIDFEGVTMRRGELTTGMYGEGYVDRRHPHTYLHEMLADLVGEAGAVTLSLAAGKGFVPFGSDDPMLRPLAKYPVNHHHAQILERAVIVAGTRYRSAVLEASLFNGDEPVTPSSFPTLANFADSWATRVILGDAPLEARASYAFVRSPESSTGQGLDQIKLHASAGWRGTSRHGRFGAFAEWARTREENRAGQGFTFDSWLGEAELRAGEWSGAARLEVTDRAEEERTSDPFRTALPKIDHSLVGITRWNVATVTIARGVITRTARVRPFAEVSLAQPRSSGPSPFQPRAYYGSDRLWMISAGARLAAGPGHAGMGYYGVRRHSSTIPHHQH